MSDQVFVPSLPTEEAMVVTPDCTLVSNEPSFACSLTFEPSSVAFSAAVLESLKTESFATPAHFAAFKLTLDSEEANRSGFEEGRCEAESAPVLPKPQYFGLPLPRPEGYC